MTDRIGGIAANDRPISMHRFALALVDRSGMPRKTLQLGVKDQRSETNAMLDWNDGRGDIVMEARVNREDVAIIGLMTWSHPSLDIGIWFNSRPGRHVVSLAIDPPLTLVQTLTGRDVAAAVGIDGCERMGTMITAANHCGSHVENHLDDAYDIILGDSR